MSNLGLLDGGLLIQSRVRASAMLLGLIAIALLDNACRASEPRPVAIQPEDMCAYCKMAISERRFAAELVDQEGEAFKFDDIICMARFMKEKRGRGNIVARFVTDFETKQWLNAVDAYYVQSSEIKTPMGGGIVAFEGESKAREAVEKYQGKLLRLGDVIIEDD